MCKFHPPYTIIWACNVLSNNDLSNFTKLISYQCFFFLLITFLVTFLLFIFLFINLFLFLKKICMVGVESVYTAWSLIKEPPFSPLNALTPFTSIAFLRTSKSTDFWFVLCVLQVGRNYLQNQNPDRQVQIPTVVITERRRRQIRNVWRGFLWGCGAAVVFFFVYLFILF